MSASPSTAPPFPLGEPPTSAWREQALSRVGELRFLLTAWRHERDARISTAAVVIVEDQLAAAAAAAKAGRGLRGVRGSMGGARVERVLSLLDAVETELLEVAPERYIVGQLPNLLAHVE